MDLYKSGSDNFMIEQVTKDLEKVSSSVSELLKQVREGEVEFATLKTELRILFETVRELSNIIRDGDGNMSVLTKLAVLERGLAELEKWKETSLKELQATTVDKHGKWQLMTAVITGILALIASAISIFAK